LISEKRSPAKRGFSQPVFALTCALRDRNGDRVGDVRVLEERSVNADMGDTTFLLSSRHSEYAHEAFTSSERSHAQATAKGEELLEAIRRF